MYSLSVLHIIGDTAHNPTQIDVFFCINKVLTSDTASLTAFLMF